MTDSAESQSFDSMLSFIGKRAEVTLDYDDPKATVTGVVHRITEDGEVHVKDEAGVVHYCWPCLRVEAVND